MSVRINTNGRNFQIGGWLLEDHFFSTDNKYSRLITLLTDHKELFVDSLAYLNLNNLFQVPINTIEHVPLSSRSNLSPSDNNLLKLVVDKLLAAQILRRCTSTWSSPAKPVYTCGQLTIEIDYSYLNSLTYDRVYVMPNLNTFAQSIEKSNLFSKIVIKDAFHQIALTEDAKHKTAFTTSFGSFEWNTLHAGLRNANQYLQELMETMLRTIDASTIKVFLGHILIHTENFEEHFALLKKILLAMSLANLKVDIEESSFLMTEEAFLGFRINSFGVSINQENLFRIRDLPIPTNFESLRFFLDSISQFANFVPNFLQLIDALSRLTPQNFRWTWIEQESFDKLKRSLIYSAPLSFVNQKFENTYQQSMLPFTSTPMRSRTIDATAPINKMMYLKRASIPS